MMKFRAAKFTFLAMTLAVSATLAAQSRSGQDVVDSSSITNVPSLLELAILLKKTEAEKQLIAVQSAIAENRLKVLQLDAQARRLEQFSGVGGGISDSAGLTSQNQGSISDGLVENEDDLDLFSEFEEVEEAAAIVVKPQVNLSRMTVSLWNRNSIPAKAIISSEQPLLEQIQVTGEQVVEPGIRFQVSATRIVASYEGEDYVLKEVK